MVSALAEKNINMAALVLFKFSQLKRTTAAFLPSPRPGQLPSPLKKSTTGVRQTFSG
jgi:hypothetical protein